MPISSWSSFQLHPCSTYSGFISSKIKCGLCSLKLHCHKKSGAVCGDKDEIHIKGVLWSKQNHECRAHAAAWQQCKAPEHELRPPVERRQALNCPEKVCIDKEKFCANINALAQSREEKLTGNCLTYGIFCIGKKIVLPKLAYSSKKEKFTTSGKQTDSENITLHISGFDALYKSKNKLLVPFADA